MSGRLIGAIFATSLPIISYVLCLVYYCFGLFNVFVDFVVSPMQGGDKDGDFSIDKGSLVQQGFVKIVS